MRFIKSNPTLKTDQGAEWECTVIEFELQESEILTPDRLPEIAAQLREEIEVGIYRSPIFLSGRGPIWLYLCLTHELHPGHSVGGFDPRIGYIVCVSHSPQLKVGTILQQAN